MEKSAKKTAELQNKLKALEQMFAERLPTRLKEIEDAMAAALAGPNDANGAENANANANANADAVAQLHRLLHSIAGTAGTFGFVELGERARLLENALAPVIAGGPKAVQEMQTLQPAMRAFLSWAAHAPSDSDVTEIPINLPELPPDPDAGLPIYLLVGAAGPDLASQLQHFGFAVIVFASAAALCAHIAKVPPAAVIIELDSGEKIPNSAQNGAAEIAHIRALAGRAVPTIIVSSVGSFPARLNAVRAGADGYFPLPVDVVALSHRLDALTSRAIDLPYRILTIDDDEVGAEFYATILRGAGMEVKTLTDPTDMLRLLGEYRPELILMDVYMPDYSGIELAQIIRQDNTYLDVPIVFLSSEHDQAKQLAAIQSGADDFLVKPIEPAHLVSAISHRAKRYRALRGLIMRDSLTGLYNHSAIKEHLMRELARAQRARLPLSLALIDLDFFKRVNDTYGHMVGDQVLRALSRLLQQWMRRSDIVGRYGGEEFVVILPGTSAEDSIGVLDNVRDAFSKVRHHAEDKEFNVTFSVGVADLGVASDADALFKAADDALYRAKNGGRNKVEKA
jgi:diguanylate cyclase (GGDEF)-like protein